MRRVLYSVACSLDGYIARLDHSVDWLPEGGDYGLEASFATIDTALIGRKTHDFMVKHGQFSMPGLENYVFSRNPAPPSYPGVHWVSTDAEALVRKLKEQSGKDIWLIGGSDLAQTLFHARLIDEVSLTIIPVLLGDGIPLFPKIKFDIPLNLIEQKAYPDGVLTLRYSVSQPSS